MTDERVETVSYEQAREVALRILTARQRSCAELSQRLIDKGVSVEVAEQVITRFQEVDLLDDAELARMIVRTEQHEKGHGIRRVRQRLMMRGIPTDLAEQALSEMGDCAEQARASAAALQLKRKHRSQPSQVQWRRIRDALLRRGFTPPTVNQVLGQIMSADEED